MAEHFHRLHQLKARRELTSELEAIRKVLEAPWKLTTKFGFALKIVLLVSACTSGDGRAPDAMLESPQTMVTAPFISGEYFCDDAVNNASVLNEDDATALCTAEGRSGADRVKALLDSLGPVTSASGNFRLGYTLDIPLLRYVKLVNGQWIVDHNLLGVGT